ncbi:hypothetical protein DVH05_014142 [Phytophthora capsici]|nr:hypothetical protein DVH05_014142 [Phytophthora capsici]
MDLTSENVRIISEYGRIIDVNPIDYARRYVGPARPSTRMDDDVESDLESPSDVLAIGLSRGKAPDGRQPDIVRYGDCWSVEQFLWRQPTHTVMQPAGPVPSSVPGPSAVPDTDASTPAIPPPSVSQSPPPAEAVPSTSSVVSTTNSIMSENVFAAIAELARTTQAALTQQAAAQQSFQRAASTPLIVVHRD